MYHRTTLRLKGYDYSSAGIYFVTIRSQLRIPIFGEIKTGKLILNQFGSFVNQSWLEIPVHFKGVKLDEYIIMPDHFHGLIIITGKTNGDNKSRCEVTSHLLFPTLGQIIAYFKYKSTKLINACRNSIGVKIWQRNYYEHIIRDYYDLRNTRLYIRNNPLKWSNKYDNFK